MVGKEAKSQLPVKPLVKTINVDEIIKCPNCGIRFRWSLVKQCWVAVKTRRQLRPKRNKDLKSKPMICTVCRKKTCWLSVNGRCWDCLVKEVKNKKPLIIPKDIDEEEEGRLEEDF